LLIILSDLYIRADPSFTSEGPLTPANSRGRWWWGRVLCHSEPWTLNPSTHRPSH